MDLAHVVAAVVRALAPGADQPMSHCGQCLVVPGVAVEWVCHTDRIAAAEEAGRDLDDEGLACHRPKIVVQVARGQTELAVAALGRLARTRDPAAEMHGMASRILVAVLALVLCCHRMGQ